MPAFNSASFIGEAIESVQAQTFADWELIVVDDASSDETFSIAQTFAKTDDRIHIFTQPENRGAAECRNEASRLATGKYIAFLDSDDRWMPDKLQLQLERLSKGDADVVFGNYLRMDEEGVSLNKRVRAIPELSFNRQRKNNYIGNLTGMYDTHALGKIESPPLRKRQDWALWMEAIRRSGKPAIGLNQDLAWYRVRQSSISSKKMELLHYNYRVYRDYLGYSPFRASFYMLKFLWEYFLVRPRLIEPSEV